LTVYTFLPVKKSISNAGGTRSALEFERIVEYIRSNPVKAKLAEDYRDWPYGFWNEGALLKQSEAPQ
jgi:hypothetical protein